MIIKIVLVIQLIQNNTQTAITNTTYVLGINNDDRLSFINVYDASITQYISSNKVYLNANLLNASSRGVFDVTGIQQVSNSHNENIVFDINGRKMNSTDLGKGIYIKNGKKIIIK